MQTVKQIMHEIADALPEQATFDDAMHTLYVRQKLERALQAAHEGNVLTQEEMEQQFLPNAR
jgi:truncated hemoglobin YjbI